MDNQSDEDKRLEEAILSVLSQLLDSTRLDPEAEKILYENLWDLYI